jgi:hypothetical protein
VGAGNVRCSLTFEASDSSAVRVSASGDGGRPCAAGSHPIDRLQTLAIYAGSYGARDHAAIATTYARAYDVGSNRAQAAALKIVRDDNDGFDFELTLTHRLADDHSGQVDGYLKGRALYASGVQSDVAGSGNNAHATADALTTTDGAPVEGCAIYFTGFPAVDLDVTDGRCEPYAHNLVGNGMNAPIAFGGSYSRALDPKAR